MANAQTLNCKKRELNTKGFRNDLKRNEWIPAIIYGNNRSNLPIVLGNREIKRTFNQYGSRGLFSLNIEGEKTPVVALIREIQKHPLNGNIVHIDFLAVNMSEKLTSTISVFLTGDEEIINKGAVLQSGAKEIDVTCLPTDLPDNFTYDISELNIGDKITVADLVVPPGVEILTDSETLIAAIIPPAKMEEEETEQVEGEENAD